MSKLQFNLIDWLGAWDGDLAETATLASLRINAGERIVTEVYDSSARTVRQHVNVSAYLLARWLLINWWRLRYEPQREGDDWLLAHSLAAIGEGFAWPALTIASDGEFIQLRMDAEEANDVASIRYLNKVVLDIPVVDFENSVDDFVHQVQQRLSACQRQDDVLVELQKELAHERANRKLSHACALQARAGIDPGDASEEWLKEADELGQITGENAAGEVMAILPTLTGGLAAARKEVESVWQAACEIDLSWLQPLSVSRNPEQPWQRGDRLAKEVRKQLGVSNGPLDDVRLAQCLGVKALPSAYEMKHFLLRGGYRPGNGSIKVAAPTSQRLENRRFYFARVIASSVFSSPADKLLPVTDAMTAMQKAERAFAQELLCPWQDLNAFTDENGYDVTGIAKAAKHFQVSERLIETTLVNKKKLSREYLTEV